MEWLQKGACRNYDGDWWFPDSKHSKEDDYSQRVEKAKAVCWNECPVREECLAWANETKEGFGIWGGHTTYERIALRRNPSQQRIVNLDRQVAINALKLAKGIGIMDAARELGVHRNALYYAWKKHGLEWKRKGKSSADTAWREAS